MGTEIDLSNPKTDPLQQFRDFLKWSQRKVISHIFKEELELFQWQCEYDKEDIDQLIALWQEIGIIGELEDSYYGLGYRIIRKRLNEIDFIYD